MEEKIHKLELEFMEIKTDLKYIKDSLKENLSDHDEILGKIDKFIASANDKFVLRADHNETMRLFGETIGRFDDKYSPRILWTIACWFCGTAGTIVVAGGIYFLIDMFLHLNK
jgi:hypothetical protein